MVIICQICKKEYSSYASRSNHVKKYHIYTSSQKSSENHSNITQISSEYNPKIIQKSSTENIDGYKCKFCDKTYKFIQGRWKHEQKCKKDTKINDDKIMILEGQIEELKDLLLKAMKIHPKTLNKINKQLNNNGTINNIGNQNIINIVPLGHENLNDILSDKEKLRILNKRGNGLKEIVDLVHVSDKFTQFKNVYITNLQNTIGYKFDQKNNQFIAVNKSELLDDLIDCRMYDIEQFYDNLEEKLDPETSKIVKRFIDRMNNNDDELKGLKKEEIKLYLYNSRDKIKKTSNIEI